jgi:adenine-specific DNA-methyltransferase
MFRLFSGHTQVNADDLRRLKYPSLDELKSIGMQIGEEFPDQNTLDRIINTIIGTHS